MTARTDAERRVRSRVRALDAALRTDPINRGRVAELAEKLGDAVDALPSDDRLQYLDAAVGRLATEALTWAHFPEHTDPEDMTNAIVATNLIRRALRTGGVVPPF